MKKPSRNRLKSGQVVLVVNSPASDLNDTLVVLKEYDSYYKQWYVACHPYNGSGGRYIDRKYLMERVDANENNYIID